MQEMNSGEIESLLSHERIGRLAMASATGYPYVIPMPYCWLDGTLYVRVANSGRKSVLLQENNRVCFEIDTCSDDMSDYASILIEGRLEPVDDVEEKLRVRHATASKYQRLRHGFRPGHKRNTPIEKLPLCKIQNALVSGRKRDTANVAEQL